MNIQNNNVNFEARRILNVRKPVKNGADEIIDIFALEKNDKKFMARCNAVLQKSERTAVSSSGNITLLDSNANNGFKNFFQDFLIFLSGKKNRFFPKFEDIHSYIAIKNGETISGIAEVSDANFPAASLDRMIFPKQDKLAEDSLLYGILSDLKNVFKREGQSGIRNIKKSVSPNVNQERFLKLKDFDSAQHSISRKNKNIEINEPKDTHQYDLEDFLGIKDFETEIMN